jgi:hypothetical protein
MLAARARGVQTLSDIVTRLCQRQGFGAAFDGSDGLGAGDGGGEAGRDLAADLTADEPGEVEGGEGIVVLPMGAAPQHPFPRWSVIAQIVGEGGGGLLDYAPHFSLLRLMGIISFNS